MSSIYIPPSSGTVEIGSTISGATPDRMLYVDADTKLAVSDAYEVLPATNGYMVNNGSFFVDYTGISGFTIDAYNNRIQYSSVTGTCILNFPFTTTGNVIEIPNDSGTFALREWITAQKGAVNGIASLDGSAKVPLSQLPYSVLTYNGTWDATNPPVGGTPTLAAGVGDVGDIYIVSVGGDQDLGNGTETFDVGNLVIYNGTTWDRIGSAVTGTITNVVAADSTIQVDNGTTVPELRCLSAPKLTTTRKINNVDFSGESDILLNSTYTNTALTSYTFLETDNQKIVIGTSASTQTFTVPTNATPFPTGTRIDIIRGGTGKVRIIGAGGVTVNSINSMQYIASQWGAATLLKTGLNTWILIGNLSLT
jgi:hypothetical protein